jgi:hypothetical protein
VSQSPLALAKHGRWFNMSTIKVNTIEEATSGGATYFTAKAWANFNGVGTVSILADGNVSSITDRGVGLYTANLTTSTSTSNQAVTGGGGWMADLTYIGNLYRDKNVAKSTGSVGIMTAKSNGGATGPAYDASDMSVVVTT